MTAPDRGRRRLSLDVVDSTNKEAARRAAGGERGPLWISASQQTAGRGRSGRAWKSPIGNFAATLLLPFSGTPAEAPRLGFITALAVADTVSGFAPGAVVRLKWPNDVLLENRKVAGILLESFGPGRDGALALAIGVGMNLATHPEQSETRWPATSVHAVTGSTPSRDAALDHLDDHLDRWLTAYESEDFTRILYAWKARAAHLGQEVTVQTAQGPCSGRFSDLDADGALVLETSDGAKVFAAGDVTLGEHGLAACD